MEHSMNSFSAVLSKLISDPYEGPFEGEDYFIDVNGTIQVPVDNVKLSALVMRQVNISGKFDKKLVKIGQSGDNIILGFDTLVDQPAVYTGKIGFRGDVTAEIKKDEEGKFCIYLDKKRSSRLFKKLSGAKLFLKRLDSDLQQIPVETEQEDD